MPEPEEEYPVITETGKYLKPKRSFKVGDKVRMLKNRIASLSKDNVRLFTKRNKRYRKIKRLKRIVRKLTE